MAVATVAVGGVDFVESVGQKRGLPLPTQLTDVALDVDVVTAVAPSVDVAAVALAEAASISSTPDKKHHHALTVIHSSAAAELKHHPIHYYYHQHH